MWFSRFGRLKAAIRNLASDPHAQGQAAKIAGVALVADGFIGLENPLDGKKSRSGIFGTIFLVVVGGAFFAAGTFIFNSTKPHDNGVTVEGTVIAVERGSENSCSLIVEYQIGAERLTTSSATGSSDQCDDVGRTVEVSYLPDQPGSARVVESAWFGRIFQLVGGAVMLIGLSTMLVRFLEICVGVYLWFWGRRRVRQHPPTASSDWMGQLRAAWGGDTNPGVPASATTGVEQLGGLISEVTGLMKGASSAPPPPPMPPQPTAPPAGWYPDNASPTGRRWWDGQNWTAHT
jgi:hypothetical protein